MTNAKSRTIDSERILVLYLLCVLCQEVTLFA